MDFTLHIQNVKVDLMTIKIIFISQTSSNFCLTLTEKNLMEEIQIENCSNVETKPHPHIKRNYVCIDCGYRIQNPRLYLEHRRDIHHELLTIHQCNLCVYASKHSQKLFRHQSTVHRNLKRMGHIEKLASVNSTPKSHMNDSNRYVKYHFHFDFIFWSRLTLQCDIIFHSI